MIKLLSLFFLFFIPVFSISAHESADKHIIHLGSNGFEPKEISIKQGETVIFENTDKVSHWVASDDHPTHEIYSEFDPKRPIKSGESWEFTFTKKGEWQFHDHLFPEFSGVVRVGQTSKENPTTLISRLLAWINQLLSSIKNTFKISSTFLATPAPTFYSPKPYTLATLENENPNCSKENFQCFDNKLQEITQIYGPKAATELLIHWQSNGTIERSVDDHQLSHRIGRATASKFGVNTQSFLLCPMQAFNGGCQHGFFEEALGHTSSSVEAAKLICESLGDEYSAKFQFYCYHGVGHGIMMSQAYDLNASLAVCDQLPTPGAQDGCWQGVFMENVNGALMNESKEGIFSLDNPLAPCNKIALKYQHECFINHSGWLMKVSHNNFAKAASLCLKAPNNMVSSCLQSIGLMVTNPSWQANFGSQTGGGTLENKAWTLCTKFPKGYVGECVIGAVDNLLNFDGLDTSRSEAFCSIVSIEFKELCAQTIAKNLKFQSTE